MNTQMENLKNVPEWNGTRPEIQIKTLKLIVCIDHFIMSDTNMFFVGEMTEDNRSWREIHRRKMCIFQPYDIQMDRAKQRRRRASQPSPASPAPLPPPGPCRRRRFRLRALPEGEDSRPVPSAPPAIKEED